MITTELIDTLRQLDKAAKLQVIQLLASEMAEEEAHVLKNDHTYPVWSPHNADQAADVMVQMLKEASHLKHEKG